jgi:tetratricopeptide (TPR) repeat protein
MVDRKLEIGSAGLLARHAIEIGRDDAVALSYSGHALAYVVGDLDDGAAFVYRALALNPNLAVAWGSSGWMKICFGEPDLAIEHIARALRLSPLDPHLFVWQFYTALAHFCASRHDEAVSWAERALRDQPNLANALRILAASHALEGRPADGHRVMARLLQLYPELRASTLGNVMPPFRRPEDRAKYVEGLRLAGLPE